MTESDVRNGDACIVTGGTHKGKTGVVADLNTSKSGAITLTVEMADGDRFKTLAKNVQVTATQ